MILTTAFLFIARAYGAVCSGRCVLLDPTSASAMVWPDSSSNICHWADASADDQCWLGQAVGDCSKIRMLIRSARKSASLKPVELPLPQSGSSKAARTSCTRRERQNIHPVS